ncbi:MAG: hypothetical protein R3E63_02245 [Pseudomonadales bacterium]
MSPVFISGSALQETNQSLYEQWSSGEFSSQYIEDRIALLSAKLGANITDTDYSDVQNGTYFVDSTNNLVIGEKDDGFLAQDNKQILFGAESSDTLTGGNNSDHLYGAGGSDYLSGGAGNDYLEGGAGDDIIDTSRDNNFAEAYFLKIQAY